jgi:hypothetical protein
MCVQLERPVSMNVLCPREIGIDVSERALLFYYDLDDGNARQQTTGGAEHAGERVLI